MPRAARARLDDPLRQALEHFAATFEDAPLGMALVDIRTEAGRFLDANRALCELTGRSREQLMAVSWQDITHPDDVEGGRALAARLAAGEIRGFQLEKRYVHTDGHVIWVLFSATVIADAAGTPLCLLTHVLDVTDRRLTEETLRRREQQLAEAQRLGRLGSWEWDILDNRIVWSDELYRIFGLTPEELDATYEGFLARVHPDDRKAVSDAVALSLRTGEPYAVSNRVVRPDGAERLVDARGEVLRDPEGQPVRMIGTAHDVTEARQAEEALREANSRLCLLQAMTTAANEATEPEDALRAAVDEFCVHTGWWVGHAFLRDPSAGDPDAQTELTSAGIWRLPGGTGFESFREHTERTRVRPGTGLLGRAVATGRAAWVSDVVADPSFPRAEAAREAGLRAGLAVPVVVGGEVMAVLEFFSQRVLEEDEALVQLLGQTANQLGRVFERRRASDELARARDAAVEGSRLKSEFLATMSHEIRTPMNGVIGLINLLLDTPLDETQRRYAEGVQGSGAALLAVINDILDFSKLEAGKVELESVGFDPRALVEDVAELMAQEARNHRLELVAYCEPAVPPRLRGDPGRIRQILFNLVSNALKFTLSGEVVIRAGVAGERGDHLEVRFEVTDTGIGLAAADQQRIFDSFSQANASTTRRYGGTGLGLAICRRLIELLGGRIGVESEPGRGSTFWFTVPLARQPGAPERTRRRGDGLLEGLAVLVVDDNETNRLILDAQLRAWGARPQLVADGPSALAVLRRAAAAGRPHAVALLDVCMEGMDGVALARAISSDPALAATRLVLLTSSMQVRADEARESGVRARLTKPVRHSQLYDTLVDLVAPPAPASPPRPAARLRAGGRDGSRGCILVAEDNAVNQLVAEGILANLGFSVDVVADGVQAVEAVSGTEYAAVLMDCHMPEMDGFEATERIRRRERGGRRVPIIAMTAAVLVEDRERCLAAGMDDYVAKPVDPGAVDAALSRLLRTRAAPGQRPPAAAPAAGTPPRAAAAAAPASSADGVIDRERLAMLRELGARTGEALLADLASSFCDQAPARMAALREAVGKGGRTLQEAAHQLKGSAANLGATAVATLCGELEALGRSGGGPGGAGLLDRLAAEMARAQRALEAELAAP